MRVKPYAKLRGRIHEMYGSQATFAKLMKLNTVTLSKRLNGVRDWSRAEIEKACILLEIPITEVHLYFFS